MDWTATRERLGDHLHARGIGVRSKEGSWIMHALAALLVVVPGVSRSEFLDRYSTFLGNTIYLRRGEMDDRDWVIVVAHELVHADDRERLGLVRYVLGYLGPQIYAVLALGAVAAFWWPPALVCLLALVFLAPLPSSGRTAAEVRAYTMTLAVIHRAAGTDTIGVVPDWIVQKFTTGAYYWMCRDERVVRRMVQQGLKRYNDGSFWTSSSAAIAVSDSMNAGEKHGGQSQDMVR